VVRLSFEADSPFFGSAIGRIAMVISSTLEVVLVVRKPASPSHYMRQHQRLYLNFDCRNREVLNSCNVQVSGEIKGRFRFLSFSVKAGHVIPRSAFFVLVRE
jgi:hypothetical protein